MSRRPERNETPLERDDRNFQELLQELRVTQTGVQMLFAFLLTLAFAERFEDVDGVQKALYISTLVLAMIATVMFTAPAALHRILFRRGAKREIVEVSSRLASTGLVFLGLALTGALTLVVDVVLGRAPAIVTGAGAFLLCCSVWGGLPHVIKRHAEQGRYDGTSAPPRSPRPARKRDGRRP
ncbi:DUF6328 family protein [Streptomyces sp. SBT349]|uniref:DUF6328 family protein n=1 Tax=Streptomyces sp. SBT349 TaxID=1580539 RepID=UPI00066EE7FA|nr:DUF6328 family protein [Streptomyces sp. SBT349]